MPPGEGGNLEEDNEPAAETESAQDPAPQDPAMVNPSEDCERDRRKIDEFFSKLRVDTWVSYRKFDRTSTPSKSYLVNRMLSS